MGIIGAFINNMNRLFLDFFDFGDVGFGSTI
jgi:hypothetical protein